MNEKPLLIMIGADKGGVGKTTVSRSLLDYFEAQNIKYRAFDSETPQGVLNRFYPNSSQILDLSVVADQMKIFDTLSNDTVTVIDVRAGLLSPTLETLGNVGLLDMVREDKVCLVVLHVLGPSLASLREIEQTADIIKGAKHFLVKNYINNTNFFDWDKETFEQAFKNIRSGIIEIPHLNELAAEHIEQSGATFTNFINNKKPDGSDAAFSMVLRGYVRTWLKKIYENFNSVELNNIAKSGNINYHGYVEIK